MQESTQNTKETKPTFKRRGRIGLNILDLKTEKGVSSFLKIDSYDIFEARDGRKMPYWNVINLSTGEEGMVWIDGGMRGQLSKKGGPEKVVGSSLEFIFKGQKKVEIDDETVNVNQYDIFELDPM